MSKAFWITLGILTAFMFCAHLYEFVGMGDAHESFCMACLGWLIYDSVQEDNP